MYESEELGNALKDERWETRERSGSTLSVLLSVRAFLIRRDGMARARIGSIGRVSSGMVGRHGIVPEFPDMPKSG